MISTEDWMNHDNLITSSHTTFIRACRHLLSIEEYRNLLSVAKLGMLDIGEAAEQMMARAGSYTQMPKGNPGYDFSDLSECKAAAPSFRRSSNVRSYNIGNLTTKIGTLRIVLTNGIKDEIYCFAIPHAAYKNFDRLDLPCLIDGTLSSKSNCVKWLMQFTCSDFDTCSQATPEIVGQELRWAA
jgi:hypothetical protein